MRLKLSFFSLLFSLAFTGSVLAQSGSFAFGNFSDDGEAPVEVSADNLDVSQDDGTAVFSGNVVIGQGSMRLTAPRVVVVYQEDRSAISALQASGGVTLVSGEDAAEAQSADYNLDTGEILLEGDVLLVQGETSIAAEKVTVNTEAGTARMSGRVRTILQQGGQ